MVVDLNFPASGREYCIDPSVPKRAPTLYVCTHDTDPTPSQVIHTDHSTASLLRVIKRRIPGAAAKPGVAASADQKRKRGADEGPGGSGQPAGKKQANAGSKAAAAAAPKQQPTQAFTQDELNGKTVKVLQDLLKARSLPTAGRKDELVRRMIDYQRANKYK